MRENRSGVPEVSVVIPVFNRPSSIIRAIDSVLAQTVANIEIIVVDDASTDSTLAAVRQIEDPRITWIACETNAGAAAARNRGIVAARGAFIAFLDSDDYWAPDKLARQLEYFNTAPDDVLVACCSFEAMHSVSGRTIPRRPAAGTDWALKMLDVCSIAPGSTMIARRSAFQEIGLQEPSLRQFEDWDWLIRYLKKYRLHVLPEPLVTINMHRGPSPEFTRQHASRLYQLRRQDILEQFGPAGLSRFRASMQVEYAVACLRSGFLM